MSEQSLQRIAVSAVALMILIPSLGILYLFKDQIGDNLVSLLFLLAIPLLGFFVLWRTLSSFTNILSGLENVLSGKSSSIQVGEGPSQIREMTEIVNALNKITEDFRENSQQLETLIKQFATLTELTEVSAKIPDIKELLELVLTRAMGATNAKNGTIMLVREDGQGLDIVAAEGWSPAMTGPIDPDDTLAGTVIETGEPFLVENLENVPDLSRPGDPTRYSSPSFLIMPLRAKTATIGAVCLSEKSGSAPFSRHDQQFLQVLLGQIGFAVENARLLKQARDAAAKLTETVQSQEIKLQDAQQQILQSEKLSALGQLIAGVSHEINNPLTTIVGYADLVLETPDKNKAEQKIRTILSEAKRATRIVQNLLSFARERKPEKRPANLNDLVRNIADLRQYDLRTRNVTLVTRLNEEIPSTMVDTDQIQQVLLNMVNNSAQAIPQGQGGRIEIATSRKDDWLFIEVEDNGKGIPENIREKIFEPFFSTKGEKTNNGLGLSISYGIVKEHGGEIQVGPGISGGTKMSIQLPIVHALSESPPAKPADDSKNEYPQVDNRRALVVDDEPNIASLLQEILTAVGFDTDISHTGKDALHNLLDNDYEIVICDIRMPEMDGFHIYREVCHSYPNLKDRFILTTGDVADPKAKQFAEKNKIQLVPKPFTRQNILESVFQCVKVDSNSLGMSMAS
ncbi:MAG: response regulator [Candidatus Omnitrophica bacterium]|nr:response regulator [Candidatus Omnitrophota bacterium]